MNNVPFALPNALIDMRIGNALANRPNTTPPHVYISIINQTFSILLHTTATAFELSNTALFITVK